jgi:uncharacterized protein YndB with AHSA1/START domain
MEKEESKSIQVTQTFQSPVHQLWDAWTNPEYIVHWWGPDGFTSTIHVMDVRVGGEWKLTLHGPDGMNFPNRSVYKEVVPFRKIVFEHFNPHFITTALFEPDGQGTRLDWTMVFDSAEMRDTIVKAHKADEGLKQNVERLKKYLSK